MFRAIGKLIRTRRRTGGLQQKITHYTRGWLYREKWTPDDELPDSSKHVENEWRLPLKIKDSPQVSSCWLFFGTNICILLHLVGFLQPRITMHGTTNIKFKHSTTTNVRCTTLQWTRTEDFAGDICLSAPKRYVVLVWRWRSSVTEISVKVFRSQYKVVVAGRSRPDSRSS